MSGAKRIVVMAEKSRAYGRALCEGIARFAQEQENWTLQLADDLSGRTFQSFKGCAGVIARIIDDGVADALRALGVPVVDLLVLKRYERIASVDNDQPLVGAWAAERFLEHRFTRFAFCGYPGVAFSDARGDGFTRALEAKGWGCQRFAFSEKKTVELAKRGIRHEHLALGEDRAPLAKWLRELPKPVAVFCCHDARAYQVLTLCRRLGIRVPDEVAVMGVDDDQILCGFATPTLSSIDPNAFEVGRLAAKTLSDLMADPSLPRDLAIRVPPKALITRASTQIYPVDPPWLSDALVFIGKNFARGINSGDVFRAVGRSHTTVEKAFRKVLNTSVHQELLRVRIETAAQLLRTTPLSAVAIAQQVGFASPQHFSCTFRSLYGLPPESYRKSQEGSGERRLQKQ